ncbi:MAG: helix-turn-helix domain-containing protein, partial [Holosporales bacterium]|nr:helix-turn-helix domain-containing protein [Holosporales bacterium]
MKRDFLTDADRLELRAKHRKEKDRSSADRIKAVLLADKGWSYRQIAEALFLDEDTI